MRARRRRWRYSLRGAPCTTSRRHGSCQHLLRPGHYYYLATASKMTSSRIPPRIPWAATLHLQARLHCTEDTVQRAEGGPKFPFDSVVCQLSVNQRLGCLEVGLLPNRRRFESQSEQDFGLCWVEVICEKPNQLLMIHSMGWP